LHLFDCGLFELVITDVEQIIEDFDAMVVMISDYAAQVRY